MTENQEEEQEKKEEEQRKSVDYESKWKRALADYRNLQKRVAERQQEFVKRSNRELILEILPVLDDLEEAACKSEDDGYKKILKKFRGVLKEVGLEEIEVKEKEFDPAIMECVEVENGELEEVRGKKIVNKVARKGYNLHGDLLRPARVQVSSK